MYLIKEERLDELLQAKLKLEALEATTKVTKTAESLNMYLELLKTLPELREQYVSITDELEALRSEVEDC